jgi:hypothetical protein
MDSRIALARALVAASLPSRASGSSVAAPRPAVSAAPR